MHNTDASFSVSQKEPPLDADLRPLIKELRDSMLSILDRGKLEQFQTDQDELTLDRDLALQLCASLANRREQMETLALAAEVSVARWMNQIIRELCHNQRFDDALLVQERSTALTSHKGGVIYRPLLLLMAGQAQAAWQQTKSDMRDKEPHPDLLADVVEMFIMGGKWSDAEKVARMLLHAMPPDWGSRGLVRSQLLYILIQTGRKKEARRLEDAEPAQPHAFGPQPG